MKKRQQKRQQLKKLDNAFDTVIFAINHTMDDTIIIDLIDKMKKQNFTSEHIKSVKDFYWKKHMQTKRTNKIFLNIVKIDDNLNVMYLLESNTNEQNKQILASTPSNTISKGSIALHDIDKVNNTIKISCDDIKPFATRLQVDKKTKNVYFTIDNEKVLTKNFTFRMTKEGLKGLLEFEEVEKKLIEEGEKIENQKEKRNIINIDDMQYNDKLYKISLDNYDNNFYFVYARHEHEALDILIDYFEEKDINKGYYSTFDYLIDNLELTEEEMEERYIIAGNYCRYIDIEHLYIEEVA